eukprot:CAMPEP_0170523300 /NCGR_PEP_ID=MMETSP0209-20121228/8736_1 /TAXON_ID=665100 ORGANISM="Litonotus pictus, Strain P1" /NCGR_SAMPLE_ID=MMETSP0209 /ASSEMBLY_ACC=CAM_ASM_000301 /LENGTH=159 /DNA_ID=CAMNT_0010811321 /DNA_START=13 /DNA_END=492 /DNA_ORIENTATION=+
MNMLKKTNKSLNISSNTHRLLFKPQYFNINHKFFSSKSTEPSVYDQLGGEAAINAVVDSFYKKVLADDLVNSFFKGIDMEKQAIKQKSFIAFACGGPNNYKGKDMVKGHAHMAIEDKHFDEIVKLLVDTLKEFKVPDELIGKVGAKLLPLRKVIVNTHI